VPRYAASSGSIEMVEWLRQQQGIVIDAETMSWAAGAGQIAMCQHLRSTGCEWNAEACTEAVISGELDTLRWLREHGCPWDANAALADAAANGFTDILDYVEEQGAVHVPVEEVLTEALNCAGVYDQLPAAQWLRARGAQWPAVLAGDMQGDLELWSDDMILWARAEGCTSPAVL
jgi:hypothetical protein